MNELFNKMLDEDRRREFLDYRTVRGMHADELLRMQTYLMSARYETDVQKLAQGIYEISVPIRKDIPKGYTTRRRTVYHFEEDEMTLFRMMSFVLHDYEHLIPSQVYSFKRKTSAKQLIERVRNSRRIRSMYVAKSDIKSYGNSINAERLISMLEESLGTEEPQAVALFAWLLRRRQYEKNHVLYEGDTAALPGIPIHNFFTNLYLTDTDRRMIPRCELYARYSDDIIMYVESREQAEENLELLMEEFREHGLQPHEDSKTGVFEPGKEYEYLGFRFDADDVDIARPSVKKLKRKMRIRTKRIARDAKRRFTSREEKARHLIDLNHKLFFGREGTSDLSWIRWAFPVITKTDALHELDLYSQECIRYLLTGKWSPAQHRVSYQELKELGYESLVRSYYRRNEILGEMRNSTSLKGNNNNAELCTEMVCKPAIHDEEDCI